MAASMKSRFRGLVRRAAASRHLLGVLALFTIPHVRTRQGTEIVIREHYGMQLGRVFDTDAEAASHYYREGWRLGVVPTPFIHAPATRFSLAASWLLRNELARVARGAEPRNRWLGTPSRLVSNTSIAPLLGRHGGWISAITAEARRDPRAISVLVRDTQITWEAYLKACEDLTPAAKVVLDQRLIDQKFYESQLGGARALSLHAALDDYLSNGELDGRSPHPFFEAEWYEGSDRTQVRRGRPVNQLLDFVARGELGQASPHFWGQRHLDAVGAVNVPVSLLAHFTADAAPEALTPAAEYVTPITRSEAEKRSRQRVADYHRSLGLLRATGPELSRHLTVDVRTDGNGTCLVVVDERHLKSPGTVEELRGCLAQSIAGLRVVVVSADDVARRPELNELVEATPEVDVVSRRSDETMGTVVQRFLEDSRPDGWTVWTPGQIWDVHYLGSAVGALLAQPTVSAAAVVGPTTPQPWLRTDDAMWLDNLDGAGVVFRGSGPHALLADPALDYGIMWHRLIEVAASRRCAILREPLIRVVRSAEMGDDDSRTGVIAVDERPPAAIGNDERRVAANAARSRYLVALDRDPAPGTAVVIPTYEDWRMTVSAVRRVLLTTDGQPVSVVVIDNGSRRPVASILDLCFAGEQRVRVRRMPRNTDFALGSNVGATEASAEHIVFLNNDTAVMDGWLEPLITTLADETVACVQPLLLYGDRTVQTAGTIFVGGMSMPQHLLVDVHPIDVGPSVDEYEFSALTAACLAVRFRDLASVGGFDVHYANGMEDVDLCLRLKHLTGKAMRVRTASKVVHFESRTPGRYEHQHANRARFAQRWRDDLVNRLDDRGIFDSGPVRLDDVRWRRAPVSPLWEPDLVLGRRSGLRVAEPTPRLRWAIKSSATGDVAGDTWGDTFFADALADALRRHGQEVVIDRASSHSRDSSEWDDVTLSLRGLARFIPQPGATNLLWIISHPDLVTRHELASGFDQIYSAGPVWAARAREAWGIDVHTLLQATDATRFHPEAARGARRQGTLFVGRTRGIARPIVTDTIAAGGTPEIYGDDGWEQFIDPRFVKGSGMANEDVPAAYASADIVLNDHWKDMAEFGFLSNRLFDAAATGTRIISDPVPGIRETFGDQVQTYTDVDDLRSLLDARSGAWPTDTELVALAERVIAQHSFDRRAGTLIDDALAIRRRRG